MQVIKPKKKIDISLEELPSTIQLEQELKRERYKYRYKRTFKSTVALLIVASAIAILVATLWLPVLQIYGESMTPTLYDGDIVVSLKTSDFQTGDIIAFYYNNKILVKRVIAEEGDWVDILADGTVTVNGEEIDEPYLTEKSLGECDLELPYQVPDGKIFVMGDHRSVSIDSRSDEIGCVSDEQVVGKLVFRVWPITKFGQP